MAKTYEWKSGTKMPARLSAQKAGRTLEKIRKERGGSLDAPQVVEASRPEEAYLHNVFEWNDGLAAEKHRETQARALIRSVLVVLEPVDGEEEAHITRAFVHISIEGEGPYTSVDRAMNDWEMREQVVFRAWQELKGWQERHRHLEELAKIFSAIDRVDKVMSL